MNSRVSKALCEIIEVSHYEEDLGDGCQASVSKVLIVHLIDKFLCELYFSYVLWKYINIPIDDDNFQRVF